ncbi:MAG: hypothetical protein ABJG68_15815 [Crocinitomicaceae bacterium]
MEVVDLSKKQADCIRTINFYLGEIDEIKSKNVQLLPELVIWLSKELSYCTTEKNQEAFTLFEKLQLEHKYDTLPKFDHIVQEISKLNLESEFNLDLEITFSYYQKYVWLCFLGYITQSWNVQQLNLEALSKFLSNFQKSYRNLKEAIFTTSNKYKGFSQLLYESKTEVFELMNKYETPIDTLKISSKEIRQAINYPEIAIYRPLYEHLKRINRIEKDARPEFQRVYFDMLFHLVRKSYADSYLSWSGKEDEQLKEIVKPYQINRFKLRKIKDFTQDR